MLAQKAGIEAQPCTKSGAPDGGTWRHMTPNSGEGDPELTAVMDAWPRLGRHVKLAMLALVETSR